MSTADIRLNILIIVTVVTSLCAALKDENKEIYEMEVRWGVEPGCCPLMMTFDFSLPFGSYGTKTAFLPEKRKSID